MIDLVFKNYSTKFKITAKCITIAVLLSLAILLPQVVHVYLGANYGAKLLPMYLPVLLGACLVGVDFSIVLGIFAPVLSYMFTGMPNVDRLPFMVAELLTLSVLVSTCVKVIPNKWFLIVGITTSFILARVVLICGMVLINGAKFSIVFASVKVGVVALLVQCVLAYILCLLLRRKV